MTLNLYSVFSGIIGAATTASLIIFSSAEQPQLQSKDVVLKPATDDRAPANYSKGRAPLLASIERIDESNGTEVLRLKATVRALRDYDQLKIVWSLPAEVKIISGQVETSTQINSGESQSFEILVSQTSSDNQQIFFQAQTTDREIGDNEGAVAEYNTKNQELIRQKLKENFLNAKEKVRSGELRKMYF